MAVGETGELKLTSGDLRSNVISCPLPNVWLVFRAGAAEVGSEEGSAGRAEVAARVDLPPEASKILSAHWAAALTFFYDTKIEGVPDAGAYRDKAVAHSISSRTTTQLLEALPIDAPDGKRNISPDEASDLVRFLNAAAANVISQAKTHKL